MYIMYNLSVLSRLSVGRVDLATATHLDQLAGCAGVRGWVQECRSAGMLGGKAAGARLHTYNVDRGVHCEHGRVS